jgi:NADH-quinone oxidoreductase subunit A
MTLPMLLLSQAAPPTIDAGDAPSAWLPVALLIVIGVGFAVTNIVASLVIGPSRTGPGKETTYESGMMPVGDTRRRFNVRFYIVAMIFLVIDVEIVFFYPFATIFAASVRDGGPAYPGATAPGGTITAATMMLISMGIFVAIFLLAYVYAWGKGVFRWD